MSARCRSQKGSRRNSRDIVAAMERNQLRVLAVGAASLVLLIAATLVVDWFRIEMPGTDSFGIDLRSAHGCDAGGNVCASSSLSEMQGV